MKNFFLYGVLGVVAIQGLKWAAKELFVVDNTINTIRATEGETCKVMRDCGGSLVCFAPTEWEDPVVMVLTNRMEYQKLEPYFDAYTCVSWEDLRRATRTEADTQ